MEGILDFSREKRESFNILPLLRTHLRNLSLSLALVRRSADQWLFEEMLAIEGDIRSVVCDIDWTSVKNLGRSFSTIAVAWKDDSIVYLALSAKGHEFFELFEIDPIGAARFLIRGKCDILLGISISPLGQIGRNANVAQSWPPRGSTMRIGSRASIVRRRGTAFNGICTLSAAWFCEGLDGVGRRRGPGGRTLSGAVMTGVVRGSGLSIGESSVLIGANATSLSWNVKSNSICTLPIVRFNGMLEISSLD